MLEIGKVYKYSKDYLELLTQLGGIAIDHAKTKRYRITAVLENNGYEFDYWFLGQDTVATKRTGTGMGFLVPEGQHIITKRTMLEGESKWRHS